MSKTDTQTFVFPQPRSPTKDDLKPNPHPYAIKTTSTALLTRSNSSPKYPTNNAYYYVPSHSPNPSQSPERSPNSKRRESGHRHHYSRSLSDESPRPLPAPPSAESASPKFPEIPQLPVPRRSKRADTLPTSAPGAPASLKSPVAQVTLEDLPPNPKLWTPSQLSSYLSTALRVKSGETIQLPAPVAKDIAAFVRNSRITGKSFLKFNDEDLERYGLNKLWRNALMAAARNLRQNVLKGRIWGFDTNMDDSPHSPSSDQTSDTQALSEDEDGTPQNRKRRDENPFTNGTVVYSSDSSTSSLEDLNDSPLRHKIGRRDNGRVKGMVASFERSSSFDEANQAQVSSSSFGFGRRNSQSSASGDSGTEDSSHSDVFSTTKEKRRPLPQLPATPPYQLSRSRTPILNKDEEPSMEELLASAPDTFSKATRLTKTKTTAGEHETISSPPGLLAWEAADGDSTLVTVKRIPGEEASTSQDGSIGKKLGEIFDLPAVESPPIEGPSLVVPSTSEVEVDATSDIVKISKDVGVNSEEDVTATALSPVNDEATVHEFEELLNTEIGTTKALIESMENRLQVVEAKIAIMEEADKERAANKATSSRERSLSPSPVKAEVSKASIWMAAFRQISGLSPRTQSPARTFERRQRRLPAYDIVDRILDPRSISELPPYIILVSLCVSAVILKVIFKKRIR